MSDASVRQGLLADMALYQAGDMAAFERVYASLGPRLRSFLARLTGEAAWAEDLVQEAFLQMH